MSDNRLTQEERKHIEYRPELTYTTEDVTPIDVGSTEDIFSSSNSVISNPENSVTELYNTSLYIIDELSSLLSEAEKRLVDTKANNFTFQDYKQALDSLDSFENEEIMDTWEDYHGDVDGDLIAELYTDIKEVKEDWDNIHQFIGEAIVTQLYDNNEEVSGSITAEKVAELEARLNYEINNLERASAQIGQEVTDAVRNDEDVEAVEGRYQLNKRKLEKKLRVLYSKSELTSIIGDKALSVLAIIRVFKEAMNSTPKSSFNGDIHGALFTLMKQVNVFGSDGVATKTEIINALKKIKVMLKYSVDQGKSVTKEYKAKMRNVTSKNNKKNLNTRVTQGVHFRNNVCHDTMELFNFTDIDNMSSFNIVAGKVVSSLVTSEKNYNNKMLDLHKMHQLDIGMRHEKVGNIVDKNVARDIYKVVSLLINHISLTTGRLNEQQLLKWLRTFISSIGLN